MNTLLAVIKIQPTPENRAQPTKEFVADRRWRDLGFIIHATRYTADKNILVTISKQSEDVEKDVAALQQYYKLEAWRSA
jgi:hypothetical protein